MPGDTVREVMKMCDTPIWLKDKRIYVNCGHCRQCLMKSTYDWAHRIMIEAEHHDKKCVLTLTYNDEHLPEFKLLEYYDVQCFLKRLRKYVEPTKIRYFVSGEYGSNYERPHYHMIVFGYAPDDIEYMFSRHGNKFYKSDLMNKLWGKGYATVGTLTEKSALYCAKYLQKLNFKDRPHPPFVHMSLKPGIGYQAYDDSMFIDRHIYINGKSYSMPRYYLKLLARGKYKCVFEDEMYKAKVKSIMSRGMDTRTQLLRGKASERFKKKFTLKS